MVAPTLDFASTDCGRILNEFRGHEAARVYHAARRRRGMPDCIALEEDDLPIVIGCDSKVPGVATQPCILEFFDLARVEKFKRHWAAASVCRDRTSSRDRRYRKVSQ